MVPLTHQKLLFISSPLIFVEIFVLRYTFLMLSLVILGCICCFLMGGEYNTYFRRIHKYNLTNFRIKKIIFSWKTSKFLLIQAYNY